MTRGAAHVVAWAYRLSLAIAGPLLLAGLVTQSTPLLQAGVMVVMVTPLVGVIIVAGSMVVARDWPFTAVALVVIAILASSLYAAAHLPPTVRVPPPAPALAQPS